MRSLMKSLSVTLVFAVAVSLVLSAVPSLAAVNLRLGHSEAVANIRHEASNFFAKRVAELTNGEVKVEVFPAGVLGSHQACQEQVSMGVLDFYVTTAGMVSIFDPNRTQELLELPYLFDNYSQAYAFMDQPFIAKYYEPLLAKGIRYLATWDNGFRQMSNSVRSIATPADMKGLKIRVVQSEMSTNILGAMGANAVPMSYSELYTALAQKVVDGQENPFMNIYASKFYEVQPYVSVTKHQYSTLPIIIAEKTWKKLDDKQKKAIQKAAIEGAVFYRKRVVASEEEYRKSIESAGVKVNDIADLAPFRKSVEPVYEWARGKWGTDKVNEVLVEVDKIRKEYPAGKIYFGPEEK
ncbi:MAG: TRAP transporter substrate-binding protein [Syntrophobacteraceae bacterium]